MHNLGSDTFCVERLHEADKGTILAQRVLKVAVSDREVCPYSFEDQALITTDQPRYLESFDRGGTDTVHTCVDLEVNGVRRRAALCCSTPDLLHEPGAVHGWSELVCDDFLNLVNVWLGEHQDRRINTCIPELYPLLDERYRERRCTTPECCFGNRNVAVPVCICFDNGAQIHPTDSNEYLADVVLNGVEVDIYPRWTHAAPGYSSRER